MLLFADGINRAVDSFAGEEIARRGLLNRPPTPPPRPFTTAAAARASVAQPGTFRRNSTSPSAPSTRTSAV